jgi:hypothetical protein
MLLSRISDGLFRYREFYGSYDGFNYTSRTGHYDYITKDCRCNGTRLYGDVQILEAGSGAMFKVRIANPAALDVRRINGKPKNCGDWQFVYNWPDFTIEFVDDNEDFTIRFVN